MMAQPQPMVYAAPPGAGGSPVAFSPRSIKQPRSIKHRQVTPLGDPKEKLANRGVMTYGAPQAGGPTIHALVCALDYKATPNALTCTVDGNNFQGLLKACGVQHVDVLYDNQCTKQGMIQAIQKVARETGPQDTFLFFYAGHGTSVTDTDGDEEDHKDEAFVCVTSTGQLDLQNSLLTDDEFAAVVTGSLPVSSTFVSITDCCHSGSICDFKRACWNGRKGISISGCRDTQTSGDTGNGGICTHAMLLATESMQKKGKQNYKVQSYFSEVLSQDDTTFASPQDITIDSTKSFSTATFEWPLIPQTPYTAPYHGGASAASVSAPVAQPASVSAPVAQPAYTVAPAQYVQAGGQQYVTAPPAQVSHQPSYTVAPAQYVASHQPAQVAPNITTIMGGSTEMPAYTVAPAQYISAAPAQPAATYVTTTTAGVQPGFNGAAQYTTAGQAAPAQYMTAAPQYVTQGAAHVTTTQPQYTTAPAVQYTTAQPQFVSGGYTQIQQAPTVPTMQYMPAEPVGGYPPMQQQGNTLFDIIDRNHDGQITRSEFNAVVHN